MDSSDVFINLVKDILPFCGGVLGVLGIFNVFKSSANKLTAWGYLAVAITITTTVASMYLSKRDRLDAEREKLLAQQKINNILAAVNKAKHPLGNVELLAWTVLPNSNANIEKYKEYIKAAIKKRAPDVIYTKHPRINEDLKEDVRDMNGNPLIITIDQKSKYWPKSNFKTMSSISMFFGVNICVNLEKINVSDVFNGVGKSPDWCTADFLGKDNEIYYDVKRDELGIMTSMKYNNNLIQTNGKFVSVDDFYGSTLFVKLPSINSPYIDHFFKTEIGFTNKHEKEILESDNIISNMTVKSLYIDFGDKRKFSISGDFMKTFMTKEGNKIKYISVPNDDEGMEKIKSYD